MVDVFVDEFPHATHAERKCALELLGCLKHPLNTMASLWECSGLEMLCGPAVVGPTEIGRVRGWFGRLWLHSQKAHLQYDNMFEPSHLFEVACLPL